MRAEAEIRADADTGRRPFSNHTEFDIIDAYLPTALAELTPAPATTVRPS